jgi:DNA topoisomerase IB
VVFKYYDEKRRHENPGKPHGQDYIHEIFGEYFRVKDFRTCFAKSNKTL